MTYRRNARKKTRSRKRLYRGTLPMVFPPGQPGWNREMRRLQGAERRN